MSLSKRCAYLGVAIILCAFAIRTVLHWGELQSPDGAKLLTYFYTGRWPEINAPDKDTEPEQAPLPTHPEYTGKGPLQLSLQAGVSVNCNNTTQYKTELEQWLLEPLEWNLKGEEPTVLIIHTHATESYRNFGQYKESDPYHTTTKKHNMLAVGDKVAEILEANGISVVHERSLHDYPAYRNAYDRSRANAQAYLDRYPSITLILDLHRDAVTDADGEFIPLSATYEGKTAAKIELVVGTDGSGQTHDNWEKNAAMAVKMHGVLEEEFPGICRPMLVRGSRYNQDLLPGAILVEMGSAGNTLEEALVSAEVLANVIIKMASGVEVTP